MKKTIWSWGEERVSIPWSDYVMKNTIWSNPNFVIPSPHLSFLYLLPYLCDILEFWIGSFTICYHIQFPFNCEHWTFSEKSAWEKMSFSRRISLILELALVKWLENCIVIHFTPHFSSNRPNKPKLNGYCTTIQALKHFSALDVNAKVYNSFALLNIQPKFT